ncbi:hypothetical protein [Leisingera caerulea]|uniref:hypothetical protein n=1 Tax=Leisingera caerulea TaxID=506591 RepID=UPI000489B197|nr:hypothetical protein [Leisingera caerulea]
MTSALSHRSLATALLLFGLLFRRTLHFGPAIDGIVNVFEWRRFRPAVIAHDPNPSFRRLRRYWAALITVLAIGNTVHARTMSDELFVDQIP